LAKESLTGILVRAKDNLIVLETAVGSAAAARGGWETREVVSQWPEHSEYLKPFLHTPRREVTVTIVDGVAQSLRWTVPASRWKEMEIIVDPYFNIEIARLPNRQEGTKGNRSKKR
jgi:hypothetical protein